MDKSRAPRYSMTAPALGVTISVLTPSRRAAMSSFRKGMPAGTTFYVRQGMPKHEPCSPFRDALKDHPLANLTD